MLAFTIAEVLHVIVSYVFILSTVKVPINFLMNMLMHVCEHQSGLSGLSSETLVSYCNSIWHHNADT